jgi:hypothetical protein
MLPPAVAGSALNKPTLASLNFFELVQKNS